MSGGLKLLKSGFADGLESSDSTIWWPREGFSFSTIVFYCFYRVSNQIKKSHCFVKIKCFRNSLSCHCEVTRFYTKTVSSGFQTAPLSVLNHLPTNLTFVHISNGRTELVAPACKLLKLENGRLKGMNFVNRKSDSDKEGS